LNGLNPAGLNGNASILGRSFDPEGIVVSPINGHLIVSDEYGPSIYEFNRDGELVAVFETPANLLPRLKGAAGNPGALDFVAGRDANGIFFGRQDNRGFEGLAISANGKKVFAVLQDPLINEPGPNNGRDGRNLRIAVFVATPIAQATARASHNTPTSSSFKPTWQPASTRRCQATRPRLTRARAVILGCRPSPRSTTMSFWC
jgi:Esterase-like activity of phytase